MGGAECRGLNDECCNFVCVVENLLIYVTAV